MVKIKPLKPQIKLYKFTSKEQRTFTKSEQQFISKIGMLEKSRKRTAIKIFNQYLIFKPDARKIYRAKVQKQFRYKKKRKFGKHVPIDYKVSETIIPFSKRYGNFDNWLKKTTSNKAHQQRIIRKHIKHPDKSIGELS